MTLYRLTVRTVFPGGSKAGTNTWHIRTTTAPVPGAPGVVSIVKAFYDGIKGNFGAAYSWSFDGVLAEVGTATPAQPPQIDPWTVTGSTGGNLDSGPAGVGAVVGWRSSLATRRGRGRTFISPLPAGCFEGDGTLSAAFLASLRTAASQMVTSSLADGNGAISVFSQSDNVGRDIVSSKVNDRVAYLSSRRS